LKIEIRQKDKNRVSVVWPDLKITIFFCYDLENEKIEDKYILVFKINYDEKF